MTFSSKRLRSVIPAVSEFTTNLVFDSNKILARAFINGPLTFIATGTSVTGAVIYLTLVSNGEDIPVFTDMEERTDSSGWNNDPNITNYVMLRYTGQGYQYTIVQNIGDTGVTPPPDTDPPVLISAIVSDQNPDIVVLTFNEPLDVTVTLLTSAFIVTGHTVMDAAFGNANTIELTVNAFVNAEASRTTSYIVPTLTNNRIADILNNYAIAINNYSIVNNVQPVIIDPPFTPFTANVASRFLGMATFGPNPTLIQDLIGADLTAVNTWFDDQKNAPISQYVGIDQYGAPTYAPNYFSRIEKFFDFAVDGQDQLRQRMAFALSEIIVVGDRVQEDTDENVSFAQVLADGALGKYIDLLEAAGKTAQMGFFLTSYKNDKINISTGRRPDENYAREVMQLFTIGLEKLNIDGTPVTDINGKPIPTYDQSIVTSSASVWTGYGPAPTPSQPFVTQYDQDQLWLYESSVPGIKYSGIRMGEHSAHHETAAKTIIDGIVIPANGTLASDVRTTLTALCSHQSCAPFMSKQLIQRLVTSNPSPAYISRVAMRWVATEGDLFEVAKAIMLDDEALYPIQSTPSSMGKLKEPLIRFINSLRAFEATPTSGLLHDPNLRNTVNAFRQRHLSSPSVFNFFSPFYQRAGAIIDAGLVSPEFQITNEASLANTLDYITTYLTKIRGPDGTRYDEYGNTIGSGNEVDFYYLNYSSDWIGLSDTALVDRIILLFGGNNFTQNDRQVLLDAIVGHGLSQIQKITALHLILVASPHGVIFR